MHAGHGDHGLHPRLQAGEAEHSALVLEQPVDVHEATDAGAVDVAHGLEVDDQGARALLHELPHPGEEGGEHRVGEPGFLDPHHLDLALV